ncbi:MAG: GNAT family N-acetyltransferase [Oscillospiraceae bacterium]|nr:GNAT family N-acetyltransferase [Oscillospiraceae bacterium]
MLSLYKPTCKDLWFRQAMLADAETMAYNHAWGGVISFPEEDWADWYAYWIARPEGKRFYRYLREENGNFVGEIAYHFDASLDGFVADVIVFAPYRGRGFGAEGLDLLCAAAKENGISVLYDDIAADNPAIALFLTRGFFEESRTEKKIILKKNL